MFTDVASGGTPTTHKTNAALFYNPSSQTMTVQNLAVNGTLTGLAAAASTSVKVATERSFTDADHHLTFTPTAHATSTASDIRTSTQLKYNPFVGTLSAPNFVTGGNISASGNLSATNGTFTNLTVTGTLSGLAAAAITSVKVQTEADNSTNIDRYVTFTLYYDSMTASEIRTSRNAKFNPFTGRLTVKNLDVEGGIGYPSFTTVCNGQLQVNQDLLVTGNVNVGGVLTLSNPPTFPGMQPAPYMVRFPRAVVATIYEDLFITIRWDGSSNNVTLRLPTSRLYGVETLAFSYFGGNFPLGQAILMSTSTQNYYNILGTGNVDFTIGPKSDADSGALHPFYRVSLTWAGNSTNNFVHIIVEKYL